MSFWFSPSSAGSCLLSLFLLWQKVIVSFLSSIFQGENLARTNMIDLSGKVAPLWRDRDCRRASFPWQRHHCTWGLFILLAFQFLFNRAKKIINLEIFNVLPLLWKECCHELQVDNQPVWFLTFNQESINYITHLRETNFNSKFIFQLKRCKRHFLCIKWLGENH